MGKRKKKEEEKEPTFRFRWMSLHSKHRGNKGLYPLQDLARVLPDLQIDLRNRSIHSFGWGWEGAEFVLTEIMR